MWTQRRFTCVWLERQRTLTHVNGRWRASTSVDVRSVNGALSLAYVKVYKILLRSYIDGYAWVFRWMANRLMKDLLPSTTASHWSSRGRSAVVGCWLSQKLTAKTTKSSSVVSSLFLARRTSLSRQTTQFATPSMRAYVLYSLSWLHVQQWYQTFFCSMHGRRNWDIFPPLLGPEGYRGYNEDDLPVQ